MRSPGDEGLDAIFIAHLEQRRQCKDVALCRQRLQRLATARRAETAEGAQQDSAQVDILLVRRGLALCEEVKNDGLILGRRLLFRQPSMRPADEGSGDRLQASLVEVVAMAPLAYPKKQGAELDREPLPLCGQGALDLREQGTSDLHPHRVVILQRGPEGFCGHAADASIFRAKRDQCGRHMRAEHHRMNLPEVNLGRPSDFLEHGAEKLGDVHAAHDPAQTIEVDDAVFGEGSRQKELDDAGGLPGVEMLSFKTSRAGDGRRPLGQTQARTKNVDLMRVESSLLPRVAEPAQSTFVVGEPASFLQLRRRRRPEIGQGITLSLL